MTWSDHAECSDIAKALARQVQVPHLRWSRAPPLPEPRQGSADKKGNYYESQLGSWLVVICERSENRGLGGVVDARVPEGVK